MVPDEARIVLEKNDDGAKAALEAMLRIFSVYANRSHYRPGSGGLTAWKAKGLEANGDVGGRVGWKLYRFITVNLARFKRRGAPIAAVRISVGKGHTVRPPCSTRCRELRRGAAAFASATCRSFGCGGRLGGEALVTRWPARGAGSLVRLTQRVACQVRPGRPCGAYS